MELRRLSEEEFNNFTYSYPLANYAQTINYANFMMHYNYRYELLGLIHNDKILGASLILIKKIKGYKYGYAPKGFLLDYNNESLLKEFTTKIIEYYKDDDIAFIKINPEVPLANIDVISFIPTYNKNKKIQSSLEKLGYKKLKDNLNFESLFPRFNAFINLDEFNIKNISKNTRNNINRTRKMGLVFSDGSYEDLEYYNIFKNTKDDYYKDFYNNFSESSKIYIVKMDYEKFLISSQSLYLRELENNKKINKKINTRPTKKLLNKKSASDYMILVYKNHMNEAYKFLKTKKDKVVGITLVNTYNTTAKIIMSEYDKSYKKYLVNYFLFYNIINTYKEDYKKLDLNGISGNFNKDSLYYGLNMFKIGFRPKLYEFITEFDLIINESLYNKMINKNILYEEFKKNNIN